MKKCLNCDKEINNEYKYCPNCGMYISKRSYYYLLNIASMILLILIIAMVILIIFSIVS